MKRSYKIDEVETDHANKRYKIKVSFFEDADVVATHEYAFPIHREIKDIEEEIKKNCKVFFDDADNAKKEKERIKKEKELNNKVKPLKGKEYII